VETKHEFEKTRRLNGLQPRSYGDLVAVAVILSMLVSVVAWGLKLEGELNTLREQVMTHKAQLGNGILPRSEERIRYLEDRLEDLSDHLEDHDH
jgi:hypothetical protein